MRVARWLFLGGLLAFPAAVACGESDSKDTAASGCATSADCSTDKPYCSPAGECLAGGECGTDADCVGDKPYCGAYIHTCDPCREDGDCPSGSVCAVGWEGGVYCAECRQGDSSTCPSGTICVSNLGQSGQGGTCEPPECDTDPMGTKCSACLSEHSDPCLNARGDCSDQYLALQNCYVTELPGWMIGDCPIDAVPTIRGCTPEACFDQANALDSCVRSCAVALFACGVF
jgi:hypothetical protein